MTYAPIPITPPTNVAPGFDAALTTLSAAGAVVYPYGRDICRYSIVWTRGQHPRMDGLTALQVMDEAKRLNAETAQPSQKG